MLGIHQQSHALSFAHTAGFVINLPKKIRMFLILLWIPSIFTKYSLSCKCSVNQIKTMTKTTETTTTENTYIHKWMMPKAIRCQTTEAIKMQKQRPLIFLLFATSVTHVNSMYAYSIQLSKPVIYHRARTIAYLWANLLPLSFSR